MKVSELIHELKKISPDAEVRKPNHKETMAMKNRNHLKKFSLITINPIRKIQDIRAIIELLNDKPKEQLLFIMGVNNGLRTGDLLKLKVKDVKDLKTGATLKIIEEKTGKPNVLIINKTVDKYLKRYLSHQELDDNSFLFFNQKRKDQPLTISSVNRLVKKWTKAINLRGNYGAYSLRETWVYIKRNRDDVALEVIAKRLNHASPVTTMREVYFTLMDDIC
jgi:integrase